MIIILKEKKDSRLAAGYLIFTQFIRIKRELESKKLYFRSRSLQIQ